MSRNPNKKKKTPQTKPDHREYPNTPEGLRAYDKALAAWNRSQGVTPGRSTDYVSRFRRDRNAAPGISDQRGGGGNGVKTKPTPAPVPKAERTSGSSNGGGGSSRSTPAARPAGTQPSSSSAPTAARKGSDQDKNRGSYVTKFKEDTARMSAASLSRQQGRSNLTSEDLKRGQEQAKASATGTKAMKATGTAQNFQQGGYKAKTKIAKDYSKASTTNQTSTAYGSKNLAGKDDNETTMKSTKMADGNKVGNVAQKSLKELADERKKRQQRQSKTNSRSNRYAGY